MRTSTERNRASDGWQTNRHATWRDFFLPLFHTGRRNLTQKSEIMEEAEGRKKGEEGGRKKGPSMRKKGPPGLVELLRGSRLARPETWIAMHVSRLYTPVSINVC